MIAAEPEERHARQSDTDASESDAWSLRKTSEDKTHSRKNKHAVGTVLSTVSEVKQ
jgi:hypothetical protein